MRTSTPITWRSFGLLLLGALSALGLADPVSAQPVGSGPWPVSTEQAQGLAVGTFDSLVAKVDGDPVFNHARALLLIRHGTLVGEAYFNGAKREDLNDLRSVTKSVVSMATGIAIARGEIPPVTAKIRDLLPDYAHLLDSHPSTDLNLQHVLTMQAGFEWDDTAAPWLPQLFAAPDLVEYLFSQQTVAPPGTRFEYSTALTQVLAKVLIEKTGMQLHDYIRQRLFRPIGIQQSQWLVRPSGDHYGGLGMQIQARDMARLGQLALQRGYWSGNQVVRRSWMDTSIRDFRGHTFGYGYQWWRLGEEQFSAIGYGGQYVYIDRALDTVLCLAVDWNVPADAQVGLASIDQLRALLQAGVRTEAANQITVHSEDGGSLSELSIAETSQPVTTTILLHRDGPPDGALSVRVDTRRGSARSRDFVEFSRMLRWEHNDSLAKAIEITVLSDEVEEPDERFFLDIERITGNGTVTTTSLPVRILDASAGAVVLTWTDSFATLAEGQSTLVTLRRKGNTSQALEVPATVHHITSAPEDLGELPAALRFSFAPGKEIASITLAPVDGDGSEPTEILELILEPENPELTTPPLPLNAALLDEELPSCEPPDHPEGNNPACFLENRYHAEAVWFDHRSNTRGRGLFAPLAGFTEVEGAQSAQVSFFGQDNVELLFKMIDGTAITGSAWVFFGKLSDLPVWVIVRDLETGKVALWSSPSQSLCGAADVSAFATAGVAPAPGEAFTLPALQQAFPGRSQKAPNASPQEPVHEDLVAQRLATHPQTECPIDAICFHDRFEVRLSWQTENDSGTGRPVPATPESGSFWFFSPANVEVGVKILDARVINGHFWFFSGALTDQDYTIHVLDTERGGTWSFQNTEGDLCGFAEIGLL